MLVFTIDRKNVVYLDIVLQNIVKIEILSFRYYYSDM